MGGEIRRSLCIRRPWPGPRVYANKRILPTLEISLYFGISDRPMLARPSREAELISRIGRRCRASFRSRDFPSISGDPSATAGSTGWFQGLSFNLVKPDKTEEAGCCNFKEAEIAFRTRCISVCIINEFTNIARFSINLVE